jgi:hypothetical protein
MDLDEGERCGLIIFGFMLLCGLMVGVFATIEKYQERQIEKLRIIAGTDEVAKRLEEVERKINKIIQLNGMSQDE